jgi:hypothetical protein
MGEKKPCEPPTSPPEPLDTEDMPKQTGQEVQVHYRPKPSPPPPGQKIPPRRSIPTVPEGEETADKNPSPPVDIEDRDNQG